jgi:hypothetical protein
MSPHAMLVSSIGELFREREIVISKINREDNGVSHELASTGKNSHVAAKIPARNRLSN